MDEKEIADLANRIRNRQRELAQLLRDAWHSGNASWLDLAALALGYARDNPE